MLAPVRAAAPWEPAGLGSELLALELASLHTAHEPQPLLERAAPALPQSPPALAAAQLPFPAASCGRVADAHDPLQPAGVPGTAATHASDSA